MEHKEIQQRSWEQVKAHPAIKAADSAISLSAFRGGGKGDEGPPFRELIDTLTAEAYRAGIEAAREALPEIEMPEIRTGDYTEHRSYGMASQRRLDRANIDRLLGEGKEEANT